MRRDRIQTSLFALLGVVLVNCGFSPEATRTPSEEPLGSHAAELCSGLSVTTLTIQGVSSYQREIAGAGSFAVSTGANGARLEYYVNGTLFTAEERSSSTSGDWHFSEMGAPCGTSVFLVKAFPMVVDSQGTRTTCYMSPRLVSRLFVQACPATAAGGLHSVALKNDGTVWTWGGNAYGQLGDGLATNRSTPTQVSGLTGVTGVSAGYYHTLALKEDGTVWSWGHNLHGQLGDGTTTNRSRPVQVAGLNNIVAVAAYGYHSVALRNDGTIWSWGSNAYGEIGDGTTTSRFTPVQVSQITNAFAIAAGANHTVALSQDGSAFGWGNNIYGQLGNGTTTAASAPVQVLQ